MDAQSIDAVALKLRLAQKERSPIPPITPLLPTGDIAAAYRVQEANTAHALSQDRRLVGRKIGLTSFAVQKQLGVDQPDYGMLFADMAFGDGEEVPLSLVLQPKVEAEVALVLGRDLTAERHTIADIIRATDFALPALEIVGSRIADWKIGILDTIADNASSGLFVLGTAPRKLADLDLSLCGMSLRKGGEVVSTGVGRACLGNPLNAARWLADRMVALGRPLLAGDIMMTGALGPMVAIVPGEAVEAEIAGLGTVRAGFGS